MAKIRRLLRQNADTVAFYSKKYMISETAARLLYNRTGDSVAAADAFMSAAAFEFYSPFLIKDMDKASARLKRAIEEKEKIVIYGDYDVDGITSVALMMKYLRSKGLDPDYYIPDRMAEGYGMNAAAVTKLKEDGASLIVTVDNGITAAAEIAEGTKAGLDFIVTDHHESLGNIPDAVAVINPKLSDSLPFRELAGVGVAFKLICAVEGEGSEKRILDLYGDIITIGTVADVVPLLSENREIVKYGLKKLSGRNCCEGLKYLIKTVIKSKEISSSAISFQIAPRINAAGRMGTTEDAVSLLMAETEEDAAKYTDLLTEENTERRNTERRIMAEAEKAVKEQSSPGDKILVISGNGWHHGVIGIIASRLSDSFFLPAVMISDDGVSAKGSGRSIEGFNLFEALAANSEYLTKFGGHELAAGLSLKSENIVPFRKAMIKYANEHISGDTLTEKLTAECELTLDKITLPFIRELSRFEPFGTSNLQPVFLIKNLTVLSVVPLSDGKYSKLIITDGKTEISAVDFTDSYDSVICTAGDKVNLFATVTENVFRDKTTLQLGITDIELLSPLPVFPKPEEVEKDDVPTVEELRTVFRYFRSKHGQNINKFGLSSLAEHINADYTGENITVAKAVAAIIIFNELGIIDTEIRDGGLFVRHVSRSGTADLNSSGFYRTITKKE